MREDGRVWRRVTAWQSVCLFKSDNCSPMLTLLASLVWSPDILLQCFDQQWIIFLPRLLLPRRLFRHGLHYHNDQSPLSPNLAANLSPFSSQLDRNYPVSLDHDARAGASRSVRYGCHMSGCDWPRVISPLPPVSDIIMSCCHHVTKHLYTAPTPVSINI